MVQNATKLYTINGDLQSHRDRFAGLESDKLLAARLLRNSSGVRSNRAAGTGQERSLWIQLALYRG